MNKNTALIVVVIFGLAGLAAAYWGYGDVIKARQAMALCAPSAVIDNSAFYFLGLACLPLFALLPFVKDSVHGILFAVIVALAIGLPSVGYLSFTNFAAQQSYTFDPPLRLFGLALFEGSPQDECRAVS